MSGNRENRLDKEPRGSRKADRMRLRGMAMLAVLFLAAPATVLGREAFRHHQRGPFAEGRS